MVIMVPEMIFLFCCRDHDEVRMAWGSVLGDWNSTSEVWDSLVDRVWEETEGLSRLVFDRIILPAGQALLNSAESAVQYTLNGEYEVGCYNLYEGYTALADSEVKIEL